MKVLRVLVVIAALAAFAGCGGDDGASSDAPRAEKVVLIPSGTAERAANGEWIGNIIPSEIRFKAGTVLVLRNEDVKALEWGPYIIEPGQELRQIFDRPGLYRNDCNLTPQLQVTLVVEP